MEDSKAAKSVKSASPEAFTEQLVGEASPVKNELVKMEAGSESETEFEEKPGSIG